MIGKITRSVEADFDQLRFLDTGPGQRPVVLLHGLFGSPDNWRPIMEDLAAHYRFLALQLPIDHNGARSQDSFQSIGQLTDHVVRMLDYLCLDRVAVCGNSLGGQVALDLCLNFADRVDGLVLTGSAGLYERSLTSGKGLRLSRNLVREQACGIFHKSECVTNEMVDEIYSMLSHRGYRRFLLRVAKATRNRYTEDELADVQAPTMVIWGRNDAITPPFVAEQFRDGIQQARLAFIDDCGHAPPIEQPKEFSRLMHAFLEDIYSKSDRVPRKPR
jgi:2-hydroxy-6-oxonona-2,4-dienedioate hydrolase